MEVGYLFCQSLVVHKGSQCLTRIVINGNDWRSCDIGECIDVILHALAENSAVSTFLSRKFGLASLGVDFIDSTTERASFVAGIIVRIGLLVPTEEVLHFELSLSDLLDEVAACRVKIEVVVTVTFTHHHEVFRIESHVAIRFFLDVLVGFIAHYEFAESAARIGEIQVETVLVTV